MAASIVDRLAVELGCAPDDLRGAFYALIFQERKRVEAEYLAEYPCHERLHSSYEDCERCSRCGREVCGDCSEDLAYRGEGEPPLICRRAECVAAESA